MDSSTCRFEKFPLGYVSAGGAEKADYKPSPALTGRGAHPLS